MQSQLCRNAASAALFSIFLGANFVAFGADGDDTAESNYTLDSKAFVTPVVGANLESLASKPIAVDSSYDVRDYAYPTNCVGASAFCPSANGVRNLDLFFAFPAGNSLAYNYVHFAQNGYWSVSYHELVTFLSFSFYLD